MLNDEKLDFDSNHFRMGYSFGYTDGMRVNEHKPTETKQNEIYGSGMSQGVLIGAEWAKLAMFNLVKDNKLSQKIFNKIVKKMNTMSGSEFELSRKDFCDFYKLDYKKYMEQVNERTIAI